MSVEANQATIRRMVEDFNRRDLAFVDEVFSPHFVLHTALTSGWPQGLEGARKMFTTMLNTAGRTTDHGRPRVRPGKWHATETD